LGTTERENADEDGLGAAHLIVNGVRADPTEGEDRAIYPPLSAALAEFALTGLYRPKLTMLGGIDAPSLLFPGDLSDWTTLIRSEFPRRSPAS